MQNKESTVIDFSSARAIKEFVQTANEKIMLLEQALYEILEEKDLFNIKEIAADVLGEDLDAYLEEDDLSKTELDFEDDTKINWDDIQMEGD
jgi:uncharacterized protein (UPF0264 family)